VCAWNVNFDQFCVCIDDGWSLGVGANFYFSKERQIKFLRIINQREQLGAYSFGEQCVDFGVLFNHLVYLVQRSVIKDHSTSTNQSYVYISANNKRKKA